MFIINLHNGDILYGIFSISVWWLIHLSKYLDTWDGRFSKVGLQRRESFLNFSTEDSLKFTEVCSKISCKSMRNEIPSSTQCFI